MNTELRINILAKNHLFDFEFTAHTSHLIDDQRIEEEFYRAHYGSLHNGNHIEMEITSLSLLDSHLYQRGKTNPSPLHIHNSLKHINEHYVCWTGKIETIAILWPILKFWSIGTAYTLIYQKDFLKIFDEEKIDPNDFTRFTQFMKEKHNIHVVHAFVKK